MADHKDYLPGETPSPHKTTHQDGGADQISVAGLLGVTAELAAHALIATAHQDAPGLIAAHAAIAAAHHARYTDAEVTIIANAQIATHAAIPTAHQNAPALIATHKADAGAHHSKYTDAEARAVHSPLSISAHDFIPTQDNYDYILSAGLLKHRTTLTVQYFDVGLILPHGVTVTKVTLYAWRDDALATLSLYLLRTNRAGTLVAMSTIAANWTDGYGSAADTTINYATIDNANYSYYLNLHSNPNNSVDDIKLSGVKIEFTG